MVVGLTSTRFVAAVVAATLVVPVVAAAQTPSGQAARPAGQAAAATAPDQGVTPPADYVIGPDDVLAVLFWREKDLSAEVVVRPDGMITLPLVNDVQAAGLTPDQLRDRVQEAASKFVEDPNATVVVKQINSRRFFVTGMVNKPGPYPLTGPTTALQAIATAGGLLEFAKQDRIVIMRNEGGKTTTFKFNYKDIARGRNLQQNIELKPGDTIIVP